MIAIVLAGGYAKRLWPLTLDRPKALLPVAGKLMIDYVVEKLLPLSPRITKIFLSTNLRFQPQFQDWLAARGYRGIELVPDRSMNEEDKLGAVRAMGNLVKKARGEDILVLAGDNLFTDDLHGFLRFFDERSAPTVALYHAKSMDRASSAATVTTDEDGRISEFIEKPMCPKTSLVAACVYAFPARIDGRFREYLEQGLPADEPGRFIEWLHKREPVYGYVLKSSLSDIGTIESYKAVSMFFAIRGN